MGFFMSVSRESNCFFKHQVDQKYFIYIHEVKHTCIYFPLCSNFKVDLNTPKP
jgi:hypothetical protein